MPVFFRGVQRVPKIVYRSIMIVAVIVPVLIYVSYKDDPFAVVRDNDKDLYEWVEKNTDKDDVFVSDIHELSANLPMVAERPVFTGNGFPFREDDFIEYNKRRFLVYGSPEDWEKIGGSWDGINITNFYRSLKPFDLAKIRDQYRLDYVIIEKDFSGAFSGFVPVFENGEIKIYRTADFK
jgi:hypothetical protein